MSNKTSMKPLALALGASLTAAMAATTVQAADANPFASTQLESGYKVAAEGKCGEGKCGGEKGKGEGKCGEGKCGGEKGKGEGKCGEGKCGGEKGKGEGKCGEGKCGAKG